MKTSNTSNLFIPDQKARESLAKKLSLDYSEGMQDWEWEISDYKRLDDFLNEYDKAGTSEKEKMSLMEIILDSLNELLLDKKRVEFDQYFNESLKRIKESQNLHLGTLHYWTQNDFEISHELINRC